MFIEMHAKQMVEYCAECVRIFQENAIRYDGIAFRDMWQGVLDYIEESLPYGSGFDSGSQFNWKDSTQSKLVFDTAFHHMDQNGYYDGWTQHSVIVTPTFGGFSIRVTGRNRNGIKEYIADIFRDILSTYVKTQFSENQLRLVPAQYDYGFNGPIERKGV